MYCMLFKRIGALGARAKPGEKAGLQYSLAEDHAILKVLVVVCIADLFEAVVDPHEYLRLLV